MFIMPLIIPSESFAKSTNYLSHVLCNGSLSSSSCVSNFYKGRSSTPWVEDLIQRQKVEKPIQQYTGISNTFYRKQSRNYFKFFSLFLSFAILLLPEYFFFGEGAVVPLPPWLVCLRKFLCKFCSLTLG